MRLARFAAISSIGLCPCAAHAGFSLNPSYSTYLGGSSWEHARDVYTDRATGTTYVVGGTGSSNFTGAANFPGGNVYNAGQPNAVADGAFGGCDVFVTKLDRAGQVVWTKYLGGQNYDRAYAVEVDPAGNVYIAGRAGIGYPTTAGLQTSFRGTSAPSNYGSQNAFITKLNANGSVQWSTYLGTGELARDLALDSSGSVYVPLVMSSTSSRTLDAGYFGAAKLRNAAPSTNTGDAGVAKIDGATGQLIWARWIGGTGNEGTNPSIRVNAANQPYLLFDTASSSTTGLPAVGAVSQTNRSGTQDVYLAKFAADGSGLVYGTYLGGGGSEGHETHSLALDQSGNAVVSIITTSTNFPVTTGALNQTAGTAGNVGVMRFDDNGARIASAVIGGATGGENPDGIYVDATGRIFISGETSSTDFPVTAGAYQSSNRGSNDGFVVALAPDLSRVEYATYFGGTLYDNGRTSFLGTDGTLYLAGGTLSANLPVLNAADSSFNGGSHPNAPGSGDAWAAKFVLGPDASTIPGDSNFDNAANFDDLLMLAASYGQPNFQTWSTGDFNADGAVDFDDLLILATHYNSGSGGAAHRSTFNVPEPTSLGGMVTPVAGLTRRRRRPGRA